MLELMAGDNGGDGGDVLAGALDSPDARAVEVGPHGLAPDRSGARPARLDAALGLVAVARVDDVDGVLEEDLGDLDAGAPCERLFGPNGLARPERRAYQRDLTAASVKLTLALPLSGFLAPWPHFL